MSKSSKSRRYSRWISAAIGLILVGFCLRLGWTVWRTETGGESVWNQWRAATVGWFVEANPLHERLPVDQAKFWLKEVERIVAEHPSDPEILMGAALVLDSPCSDFETARFLAAEPKLGGVLPLHRSVDSEGIRLANLEYEHLCGGRCAELAHSAQQIEPEKQNMSRLAALLLLKSEGYYRVAAPRTSEWISRLEEYRQVDVENGFYDYLVAIADWEESLRLERNPAERESCLVVGDAARFDRGAHSFSCGQQRNFVSMGGHEASAVAKFLNLTSLSNLEKEKVLHGRKLSLLRRSSLFRAAWRWQWELARAKREKNDAAAALELLRQDLQFIDQYVAGDEASPYDSFLAAHRTLTLNTIRAILRENAAQFGNEELAKCDRELVDSKLEEAVFRAAATRLENSDSSRPAQSLILEKPDIAAASLFMGLALQAAVIFLLLFGLTAPVARVLSTSPSADEHWATSVMAFPLAALLSIALLGVAPAEVIPIVAQQWIATIGILIGPIFLIAIVVARWFRSGRFQFSLSKLFWIVTFVSLYLGLYVFARQFDAFAQIPFDLFVPSSSTHAVYWLNLQSKSDLLTLSWRVALEWLAYHGPYLALAFWAAILLIVAWVRLRKLEPGDGGAITRIGSYCGIYFRLVASSSVWLFFLSLMIYLALAPSVLRLVESDYQWRMSFVRHPQMHVDRTKAAVEAIRSDTPQMAELREQVAASIAREDQDRR